MSLRILRVISSINPECGGPSEGIRQITPHLLRLGVQTTVLSLDKPDSVFLKAHSFQAIGLGPVIGGYGYCRGLPGKIRALAEDHDVVIIHGLWQYHSFATWRALRQSNIPYFVYTHGMLDPWFKRTYPIKHLKKWVYWPWADYRVLRDAKGVLFTTEQERDLARQSFWLYRANEAVVNYGTSAPPPEVDRQKLVFIQRFPELTDKRIFLFLSRIHPKKGVDLLIEAFAQVSSMDASLHLLIAGPDQLNMKAQLQNRSVELGISDRITWPGMLSGELKWGAFRCAELFCLPSHQENFGIVVAEALACGLPVAIAEPVNISNDVANAGAGIVFVDQTSGTKEALQKWLAMSSIAKLKMSQRALQLFSERFDFASSAKNLLSVLEAAVQARTI
ncbi:MULTISPECIES: glycosyltransferase [unclassified Synechococcus]|uniref:glycosyltransferase n=1 Tax=unclassified Synechococcus TaxID=2626047 RepID=UPI0039B036FC